MAKKAAVITGDGTGPELTKAAVIILDAVNSSVELIMCEGGCDWWEKNGGNTLIPEKTWKILEETDACLKGPTTTPGGANTPRSVAVSIRQRFDLYANVRPIRTYPGTKKPLGDVDFVCVRENTEGLYAGIESKLSDEVYIAIRKITRKSSERIARYAFDEAVRRKWKAVVAIHKSNIMKLTCGVFLEETRKVAKEYGDIELWEYHIDNMAQQLVKNPQLFNQKVLLSTNLFMDVISEECSALVASIGLIASANIGTKYAMFEPAHGSAPKYKGMDKVNPTATILAAAWMLDYLGEKKKAKAIYDATEKVIAEGKTVTYDLGGSAKLSRMADAIVRKL
jgi:isocitrate dehydrogenase